MSYNGIVFLWVGNSKCINNDRGVERLNLK